MFNRFERGFLCDAAGLEAMISADVGGGGSSAPSTPSAPPPSTPAAQQSGPASSAPPAPDVLDDDDFALDIDRDPEAADEEVSPLESEAETLAVTGTEETNDPDSEVGKLLATPRGKRIYAAFKQQQLLAKPEADGGIGFTPTVEQIKDFYQAKHSLDLMEHHFDSGQGLQPFLNYWFGQRRDGSMRTGAQQLSQQLPEMLQRVNPLANGQIAASYVGKYVDAAVGRLWEASQAEADPEKQKQLYLAAQYLHKDAHEKWFDPKERTNRKVGAEPVSAEIAELTRLRNEANYARQSQRIEAQRSFVNTTDSKIDKAIEFDVTQALASVRDRYKDQPIVFEGLRDKFVREVQKAVQQNADGMKRFNLRYETAQRSLAPEDQQDVTRIYRQMAAQVIMQKRSEYLKAAGVALKESSDAKHAGLQKSAGKKNLTQSGQPVRHDLTKAVQRQQGESHSAWMQRQINADMGHVAR